MALVALLTDLIEIPEKIKGKTTSINNPVTTNGLKIST